MGNVMQHLSEEHRAGTTEEWVKRITEESNGLGMSVPWIGVLIEDPTYIARVDEAHFALYLN